MASVICIQAFCLANMMVIKICLGSRLFQVLMTCDHLISLVLHASSMASAPLKMTNAGWGPHPHCGKCSRPKETTTNHKKLAAHVQIWSRMETAHIGEAGDDPALLMRSSSAEAMVGGNLSMSALSNWRLEICAFPKAAITYLHLII